MTPSRGDRNTCRGASDTARGVYLMLILLASSAGCASTGAVPSPFPRPAAGVSPVAAPLHVSPSVVVATALALRGVPYRAGGSDPSGFDCSGFVGYVLAQHSYVVPRTTAGQYSLGRPVGVRALQPGDLVFFSTIAPGASHVGIALSRDEFVHAPSAAGVVRVERLGAPYWSSRFIGARRLH